MRITKDKNNFKPYTLNIEIHTQDDEDVLSNLGKSNVSLPDLLESSRHVKKEATYNFCSQLNDIYGNR